MKKSEKKSFLARFLYWTKKKDCCKGFCPHCQYYSECKKDCSSEDIYVDEKQYVKVETDELIELKEMIEDGCEKTFIIERFEQMIKNSRCQVRLD